MQLLINLAILLSLLSAVGHGQVRIDNAISDPMTVYKQRDEQLRQLCHVEGPPLDLMFVIDSSGSLRDQFDLQLDVVRNTLNNLAISEDSVRISIVQYASVPLIRFNFDTYFNRADMLKRVDAFTTTGSTTNTGAALEYAMQQWTEDNGMRPDRENVKRIIFLLSDGRSTDYPLDKEVAVKLRNEKRIELFAFGLGEYIDWATLREVTSGSRFEGYTHIVNSRNVSAISSWFSPWKGVEICEEEPVCIPGSHRPLDLLFVVDSSTSVTNTFEAGLNFVRRALNSVNVNMQATRVALIVYSSRPQATINFYDDALQNSSSLLDKLITVQAVEGTTNTGAALKLAFDMFGPNGGSRPGVKKLAIVITDGFSSDRPETMARRLIELKDVDIFAVSLNNNGVTSRNREELLELVGYNINKVFPVAERVFAKGVNLVNFEDAMLNYTDKSCPGLDIASGDGVPVVQQPIDVKCTATGLRVTIRTKKPFRGMAYAVGFEEKPGCSITGKGENSITMVIAHNNCGLKAVSSADRSSRLNFGGGGSQRYEVTIGLRFHEHFDTIVDDAIKAYCDYTGDVINVSNDLPGALTVSKPSDASCEYRIMPRSQGCELLDAEVGKQVVHQWTCNGLSQRQFIFVHDCVVDSDSGNTTAFNMLSEKGCEVDQYLMQTPQYDINTHPHVVRVNTYMFKQPRDTIVRFRCLVSICDRDQAGNCRYEFQAVGRTGQVTRVRNTPSACLDHPDTPKMRRHSDILNYDDPLTKPSFHATFGVEARRINVFNKSPLTGLAETNDRRYCKGF